MKKQYKNILGGRKLEQNISELKGQIYFPRTKEYFEEVERSFYSENYRSAIVMLYSVVIADLLFKLEELKDYYLDSVAEEILEEIDKIRESNPKSSEWENKLIDRVKDKTNIIEPYVLANIEDLKNVRNFSAHPSLNQNNELIRPSREKTLGLIREMLIGIFIRPPLFIKKITNNLLDDISSKKEDFLEDKEKFKRYIEKKYFERIPQKMIISIFRDFWKITFKLDNEDCNVNRKINLEFLILTMQEYKLKILEDIQKEKDKYNNISDNVEIAIYLVEFMYYFPEVYNYLKEDNKIAIEVVVNKNNDYKTIAYYTSKNIEEHINKLHIYNFNNKHTRELLEKKIKDEGREILLFDKYIDFFGESGCFNAADSNFEIFIKPNISRMQQIQIETLIEKINNNNQLYNRGRAQFDNNEIIEKANVNWEKIDLKKYSNFEYDEMILVRTQLPF